MKKPDLKNPDPPQISGKPRGGARKGAGRKAGKTNRKTQERLKATEAAISGGSLPLDYMLAVMRDPKAALKRRDEMARAAARYCHASLQAIAHSGPQGEPIQFIMQNRPAKEK